MLAFSSAHKLCPKHSLTAENFALMLDREYEGASSVPSFVGTGQSLDHAYLSYLPWNVC